MSTRRILLEDGTNRILLEDGTNFLIREGVAQSSDDVLIRIGPGMSATQGSGILAPLFTPISVGGAATGSPFYYTMMQQWFEAA